MEKRQHSKKGKRGWLTERLRVTVFPSRLEDIGKELDWEALTGEAPAAVEQQPRIKTTVSKGPFADGELVHVRYPDRIELIYGPDVDRGLVRDWTFPNLGPLETSLGEYRPIVEKWLAKLPAIKRIAFGPVLIEPVSGHAEAYERLSGLLSSVTLQPGMSDFSYQINRPRESKVIPGLRINRLSRWGAVRLAGLIRTDTNVAIPVEEQYACRLELDVNTHQDFQGELSQNELQNLFDELIELSIEISEKGDLA